MNGFQLIEIKTAKDAANFIAVNVVLNKANPNYIRPLDKDVQSVFDPKKNKAFQFGQAIRWILKNERGEFVGRIAAFVNKKYKNKGDEFPVGGMGFFDCIHDQQAASILFDAAKNWLMQHAVQAMDGPINFGERDRWWGLVVEGFQEPLYCMNYNPPYYQVLFEKYGFRPFFKQICFGMHVKQPLSPRLFIHHAIYANDPAFSARYIDKNQLTKYADDFATVYNAAWASHAGNKEVSPKQARFFFKKMKPVIDEKVIWFAYHEEQPIAMFINLPDLNQWFKYLNGNFGLWHKLKFLWIKKTKPCRRLIGLVFGVAPKFQGKGIDAYLIVEASKVIQAPQIPYTDYEMQWIGDFNPKMIHLAENLSDTFRSRTLTTYRYLFDQNSEFKRHPNIA